MDWGVTYTLTGLLYPCELVDYSIELESAVVVIVSLNTSL